MAQQKDGKKKRFSAKKFFLIFFAVFGLAIISLVSFVLIVTADTRLDMKKLSGSSFSPLVVTSATGTNIEHSSLKPLTTEINQTTKDAFIDVEDKRFYSHHGIDLVRIGGAVLENIKSGKKKQGASTITQQLIKNTHLSGKKTFSRKLKEMKIALDLERKMTKDQILEAYLDNIYFGNGCIGIESATAYYFGKSAKDLSIAESALLAGLVKAPSNNEPKRNLKKALERKDIVLSLMHNQGKISDEEFETAKKQELVFVFGKDNNETYSAYALEAKREAAQILDISIDELEQNGYRIETYLDEEKQKVLFDNLPQQKGASSCSVLISPENGSVVAFASYGKMDFGKTRRQPASCIKPILVFGPALEEKIVTPESFVLDQKTNFGGYEPRNAGDKYLGWISVREALALSKNVPAVKILNMVGVSVAKSYASRAGIVFDEKDNNLSLALGGMTNGTTIMELAGAYTCLENGVFSKPAFVKNIKNSAGMLLYHHEPQKTKVFEESTAYLLKDMMKSSINVGTAKKLAGLEFDVAAKTGTNGNEKGNTDCYSIALTSDFVVATMVSCGNEKPFSSKITGAGAPTESNYNIFKTLYKTSKPRSFEKPATVASFDLDTRALEKFELKLASPNTEKQYRKSALFADDNHPTEVFEDLAGNLQQTQTLGNWFYFDKPKLQENVSHVSGSDELQKLLDEILAGL